LILNYGTKARSDSLAFKIAHLGKRIARLEQRSQRFSWYRLGVILAGGAITWAGFARGEPRWGWAVFLLFLAVFAGVVACHRRLDGWITRLKIWADIREGQLARLTLDWGSLPAPRVLSGDENHPLAMDLGLTGDRSLHQLLDITLSPNGSKLLANWLTQADPQVDRIRDRQALVRELASMARFRDRLLLTFRSVSDELLHGERLLRWLEEIYPLARLNWVVLAAGVLVASNLVLFILNSLGRIPAYWLISLSLYAMFYFYNIQVLNTYLEAVVQLDAELDKFRAILILLETYPMHGRENLRRLCAPFREKGQLPSHQLRKIKLATAAVGLRTNPVLGLMINLILPWDFFFAALTARYRDMAAESLPQWLQVWHNLEALICLADFAYLHPDYTYPEIDRSAKPILEAKALGHPLLPPETKIVNDITVGRTGEILIITGSNMAGKSTFIKTIGINLCLAYAGAPVNAAAFRAIPFYLHTCIRISDSLADGFSYFYAEVQCLKHLLERVRAQYDPPVLFLVDEIFRGTNNRERLIGSRSYLRALIGKECVGFLATHDLELASLADQNDWVRNYHFRDRVGDGKLLFDYRIRSGPSPTTNALTIMQMEGLPVDPGDDQGE
jgi:ABC-type multidrug transport system fused ATPase/permease subunit